MAAGSVFFLIANGNRFFLRLLQPSICVSYSNCPILCLLKTSRIFILGVPGPPWPPLATPMCNSHSLQAGSICFLSLLCYKRQLQYSDIKLHQTQLLLVPLSRFKLVSVPFHFALQANSLVQIKSFLSIYWPPTTLIVMQRVFVYSRRTRQLIELIQFKSQRIETSLLHYASNLQKMQLA